jgi:hypothetical protein
MHIFEATGQRSSSAVAYLLVTCHHHWQMAKLRAMHDTVHSATTSSQRSLCVCGRGYATVTPYPPPCGGGPLLGRLTCGPATHTRPRDPRYVRRTDKRKGWHTYASASMAVSRLVSRAMLQKGFDRVTLVLDHTGICFVVPPHRR